MKMQAPEEDEEYIVIKAGPPLPIRRPRKFFPMTFTDLSHPPLAFVSTPSRIPRPPSPCSGALSNKNTQTTSTGQKSRSHSQPLLKPRPPTPTLQVESKVRLYIEQVKKSDEINRLTRVKPEKFLSLEDLYQVSPPAEKDEEVVQDKLRKTLRILKEKDEMINKLRESCHDLKLKWADAENRVDEMRFGIGVTRGLQEGSLERGTGQGATQLPRRSHSEINLSSKTKEVIVMKDQETETDRVLERIRDNKSMKTPTTEDDLGDFDLDDRQSDFDPVLDEKCSNWLEKVQKWQTDSTHNISQDSCGDRDSGFRGSAELEGQPSGSRKHRSSRTPKAKTKSKSRTKDDKKPDEVPTSKSPTPERRIFPYNQNPGECGSSSVTLDDQEQSGPSSLQIAQPWHTFVGNLHPQSSTEYEGFPSVLSPKKYELSSGSKSLGAVELYASKYPERDPEDHSQLLRDIDKRFKTLHPLLDDATAMALRVKVKSERLAKILQDKNQK